MEKSSPADQVESHLNKCLNHNKEQHILPSDNAIIERLLADKLNMADVYGELLQKHSHWQTVVNVIIEVAAGWNPKKIKDVRDALRTINGGDGEAGLNKRIKEKADELATLLIERNEMCERFGLFKPGDPHPIGLIDRAAEIAESDTRARYATHVKEPLIKLRREFRGLNNWPTIPNMLTALALAQEVNAQPMDEYDAVALKIRQKSVRDFWRVLDVAILRTYVSEIDYTGYPDGASAQNLAVDIGLTCNNVPWLSDKSVASLTNCVLGLDGEIQESAVKAYRKAERGRIK